MATVKIADASGKMVEVTLHLSDSQTDHIATFARNNKEAYFEDHSLDWALDEIINRGIAEIKRQIKTAAKARENKAAGDLLRLANLTPEMAKALIAKLQAEQAAAAKAEAKK